MTTLDIPQSLSTPGVSFDPATRRLCITGESYPENSFEFYAPVTGWLQEYLTGQNELLLDINVSYMNSSSTKCMLDLLDLLEEAHSKGSGISIDWRYDPENPRSRDLAEEFQEEVTLPFSIIACEE
ncbi:DUF1987 domain-containing protein [Geobacter sp. SVR]|uniref:DUF1987 domain-containing protein n=1 Tax=Geobacter sp. SVR TaxID=2495594 RepID=UPI00143F04C2|nr:DUF1987 domain-containing protein [Geobacter sp. SVR]BCS52303.1 hypothetical protein GSVR_06110 [Geobacter sp. SVR]GCF85038.1 hypothetical protein GSbR_16380 [Geobacter sp. SVR]